MRELKSYQMAIGFIVVAIVFVAIAILTVPKEPELSEAAKKAESQRLWDSITEEGQKKEKEKNLTNEQYEDPIVVENYTFKKFDDTAIVEGSVKNNSKNTLYYIKVKLIAVDNNGDNVETTTSYVLGEEGLSSGESSYFKSIISYPSNARDVKVEIFNYKYSN